jgi:hypothetical protein
MRQALTSSLSVPTDALIVVSPPGHLQELHLQKTGTWLRRYVLKHGLKTRAKDEFWSWVATMKLTGWLQTEETQPRAGRTAAVPELELLSVEVVPDGGVIWVERAMILARVTMVALMDAERDFALAPGPETLWLTWKNVMARHLRTCNLGRQVYHLLLTVMQLRGCIVLSKKVLTVQEWVDAAHLLQVAGCRLQELGVRPEHVPLIHASLPTPFLRVVVLDVYSGFGSWTKHVAGLSTETRALRLHTTDRYASFTLPDGVHLIDVVLDALAFEDPQRWLTAICDALHISPRMLLLVWFSPPCDTYARCDSTNQRKRANHREFSREVWTSDGAAMLQGARQAVSALAKQHDSLTLLTYRLLILLWLLYGVPSAMENPHASMRLVPGMRALLLRTDLKVVMHTVNYCVFDHPYNKLTDIFCTLPALGLQGITKTGRCSKRQHCSPRWGARNSDTGNWVHTYSLGSDSCQEYGETAVEREYWKNMIPGNLLKEILSAAITYWSKLGQ